MTYLTAMSVLGKMFGMITGKDNEAVLKYGGYLGLVLVHSSWILILNVYFVIDQTELRDAGFFSNDKPYSST